MTTDTFIIARDLINEHLNQMMAENSTLYCLNINKDTLVDIYLENIPKEMNPVFRERRVYDCSCCRGFIKSVGNVIAIKDGVVTSVWDVDATGTGFEHSFAAMSEYIHANLSGIYSIFLADHSKMGCHHNFEMVEKVGPRQWDHFFIELAPAYVNSNSIRRNEILGAFKNGVNVFTRGLKVITLESLDIIIELINSNSLYRGEEWLEQLTAFREIKHAFDQLQDELAIKLFVWEKAAKVGEALIHLPNTAIGSLLINISDGMDLTTAVTKYESITSANRYKRSTPVFTKDMLERAKKKIEELGFMASIPRRFATSQDLTVNDTLFVDRSVAGKMKGGNDPFSQLSKSAVDRTPKTFNGVQEISAEQFISDVLPGLTGLELFLENSHLSNFVSLIAPVDPEAKSMFKWGNGFSWAYTGNVTDTIKANVAKAGGDVTGDLRFSIQWNEASSDNCDLDAHCVEPDGNEISFRKKVSYKTRGTLDVDIINPNHSVAVENITWANIRQISEGTYRFFVQCFSNPCRDGFSAQIEMLGEIYQFNYAFPLQSKEIVDVAEVTLKDGAFAIKSLIPASRSAAKSKDQWGMTTQEFIPVSLVCFSPNHWETAERNEGHRHLFFMLKGCVNDENPSGIFNEYLVNDLLPHRKVMEGLANQVRLENTPDQLSGIGFAMDKRASLIVKATGATERILKIRF